MRVLQTTGNLKSLIPEWTVTKDKISCAWTIPRQQSFEKVTLGKVMFANHPSPKNRRVRTNLISQVWLFTSL